jgi:carboxyl-terminal processing protease
MIPIGIKERREVFDDVCKAVSKKIFAPSFDLARWAALIEEHRGRILAAETVERFEAEVRELLAKLKISHVTFFHQSLLKIPPQYAIGATLQKYQLNGTCKWMFEDVHEGSPAQIAGVERGDLLLEVEGSSLFPPEAAGFRMGGLCEVTIEKLNGDRERVTLGVPRPTSKWHPILRPRLVSWTKLDSGVGLLKVTGFPGQVGIDVAKEIDHAVSELGDRDRLIVDLRGNPGGGAGGLRLMSYLTPDKIPVGYSLTRKREAKGFKREKLPRFGRIPKRKIELYPLLLRFAWSDKSIVMVTEGLGPQLFHGRIVLLVNQHTASAAETITGFARENSLATIVGTKTPGQVLGGTGFKVGNGFVLRIPVVTFRTWSGNTLEGTGVVPDHPAELCRGKLKEGIDSQLERAIEVVRAL